MKVERLVVGTMATNCYLVTSEGEVGVIDPGDDGEYIMRKIGDTGGEVKWVAATHGHFDHVLAVPEIVLGFEVPFYLHPKDEFLLKRALRTAEYFGEREVVPVVVSPTPLKEGMKLQLGEEELLVWETGGHTPGGVSLIDERDKIAFVGDVMFAQGAVGRTDFGYASEEELEKSVKRLLELPGETVVYSGHGKETTVKDLKLVIQEYRK